MTEFTRVSNVWESSSESQEEAMAKKLKAQLVISIRGVIASNGWNQAAAAENLGITQPRVSNLVNGQISKFSIDNLYKMLIKCGYMLDITSDSEGPHASVQKVGSEAA
jgi:predicted XRE-type DNA-binding protein